MVTLSAPSIFRPEINGLRAIAVILVIIFHLDHNWMPFGYVGVDMFFVISGFLITRIILSGLSNGTFRFSDFFIKRIKRILPVLIFVLIACLITSILVFSAEEHRYFSRSLRYTSAQASNFFFLQNSGYFDLSSKYNVLLHTWSLAVEEQFYLVWPFLILLATKFKAYKALMFLLIITLSGWSCFYFRQVESMEYFYMFYSRAWEFTIGGFIATGLIKPIRNKSINELISVLSILFIIFSILIASSTHTNEWIYLLLTCLGVAGIIYSNSFEQTIIAKALSSKWLLSIGLISYSLYLWHWPVIVFQNYFIEFSAASNGEIPPLSIGVYGAALAIAITLALSLLSYRYIEQPFRYSKASNKLTIIVTLITICSLACIAKVSQKQATSSWRTHSFSSGTNLESLDINVERSYEKEDVQEDILILGDSHSEHFTPMIKEWSKKHNLTSKTLHKGGTPPLLAYDKYVNNLGYRQKIHLNQVKEYILTNSHIQHVFLAASHSSYQNNPFYEEALADTIEFLLKENKRICLIAQVPVLKSGCVRHLEPTHFMNYLFPKKNDYEELLQLDSHFITHDLVTMRGIMESLKNKFPSIQLWFPEEFIDNGFKNLLPCYSDNSHLNKHGSLYFTPYFDYKIEITLSN